MLSKRERVDFAVAVLVLNFTLTGALLGYLVHTEARHVRDRESLEYPLSAPLPSVSIWGGATK